MIGAALTVGALAAAGFSARWNWWRRRAPGLPVLMYHKVGTPPPGSKLKKLWVSPAQFRWQMSYLKRHGYAPLTLADVAAHQDAGRPVPGNAVVLTFDDGYRNNLENALPILQEFGFPAVIYVVVNAVGRDNFWHDPASETRIPMLDWDGVRALQKAGWEIGSHTMNHARLSRLSAEAVRAELVESRAVLGEKLGTAPLSFANPYGDAADDPAVQSLVREAGYRTAVSVHQGKADLSGNPYCLRRLFIRGDDTAWDFHLNLTRGRARL